MSRRHPNPKPAIIKPEVNFKDVYLMPLSLEFSKVFTRDNGMAFDFVAKLDKETKESIVACVNGKLEAPKDKLELTYNDGTIFLVVNDSEISFINIRGWGHLNATLGLRSEKAAKIQDDFADFIIKKLTT